ncbi:MAG: SPOR domain-containing protein [Balneolaceae bacterium]
MKSFEIKLLSIFLILLTVLFYVSCATTEKTAADDRTEAERLAEERELEDAELFTALLESSRTQLSDQFTVNQHDIPEPFLKERIIEERETDEYAGFRIQILSTRDVAYADSVRLNFGVWADSTFANYIPESYIFFRQPQYRVHVGDFRERDRAITFSRFLKSKYPDAWVVHDRINPEQVPADTVDFALKEGL